MQKIFLLLPLLYLGFNLHSQNLVDISQDYYLYGLPQSGYTSGVSFVDFDQDGDDDITIGSQSGIPMGFFRNDGDRFTQIFVISNTEEQRQINWVDIDNDKDLDLQISTATSIRVYENLGNLNLVEITESAGIEIEDGNRDGLSYPSSWSDFNKDGYVDLLLTFRSTDPIRSIVLYENNGDNTFTDVTQEVGIASDLGSTPLATGFMDFNNDNYEDILIVQDYSGGHIMLINDQNGKFDDISEASNIREGNPARNGMTASFTDVNLDGFMDFYITNTYTDVFFLNNGDGTFKSIGKELGLDFELFSFGASFFDFDCDTDEDVYVVSQGLFENNSTTTSSTFTRNQEGVSFSSEPYSSVAIGDFNHDGYPDLLGNFYNYTFLYQNNSQDNNWITLKALGTNSNYLAIGTRVIIETEGKSLIRHIQCGQDFCSQQSFTQFFGLGKATHVDKLTLIWPSGIIEEFTDLVANAHYTFIENQGIEYETKYTGYTKLNTCSEGESVISIQGEHPPFDYKLFDSNDSLLHINTLDDQLQKDTILLEPNKYRIEMVDNLGLSYTEEIIVKEYSRVPLVSNRSQSSPLYNCEVTKVYHNLKYNVGYDFESVKWTPSVDTIGKTSLKDGILSYSDLELDFDIYEIEFTNACEQTILTLDALAPSEERALGVDLEISDPTSEFLSNGSIEAFCYFGVRPYLYTWTDENGTVVSNSELLTNIGYGIYTLQVIDSRGCERIIEIPLGITTNTFDIESQNISLYPNPANDFINIKSDIDFNTIESIEIFDTSMKLLNSYQVSSENNNLRVSELDSGIYYLIINFENTKEVIRFYKT